MRKSVFVIAVAAAVACSGVALAGEVKQDKAQVVKAKTMSDAQMDKVTGAGNAYAFGQNDGPGWLTNNGLGPNAHGKAIGHLP